MELKPNNCSITFPCLNMENCVYRVNKKCKYLFWNECTSKVAQVNAMTVKIKELLKGVENIVNKVKSPLDKRSN